MNLLVITQKIDKNDPILGFFHNWVEKLSQRVNNLIVICLEKGEYDLPKNVRVYSLGKENYQLSTNNYQLLQKLNYAYKFLKIIWRERHNYSAVFVHMNQEYVLLGGLFWKIFGKKVFMWRNHEQGNILTSIAVLFSKKVFCTSTKSFTAKFKKTVIMPAGIDTSNFKPVSGVDRKKYSICMVGRISPVKHIDLGLKAINALVERGIQVSLGVIGPILDRDIKYFNSIKQYVVKHNLSDRVSFLGSIVPQELPKIYSGYKICLNLTDSGSFDKTIVESASCGAIPLVSNISLENLLPKVCVTEPAPNSIADSLVKLFDLNNHIEIKKDLESFVKSQSLDTLLEKLFTEIK